MSEIYTAFTDITSLKPQKRLEVQKEVVEARVDIPNETSAQITALEARIYLAIKDRDGKNNLINSYITRLKAVIGAQNA